MIAIDELQRDRFAQRAGAVLAVIHALSIPYWFQLDYPHTLARWQMSSCWPFLRDCDQWRTWTSTQLSGAMLAYAAIALFAALLFLRGTRLSVLWGSWGLALISILKIAFLLISRHSLYLISC